ncbi:uncharacterized protein LOC143194339 [Rhynchophorus ferrugineus]|uniref:uncharacterized protein LOC143194339 n=1 Tax=Rhynchophorus ferrugineus TaxID=354439 RepID=UPI003FCE610D
MRIYLFVSLILMCYVETNHGIPAPASTVTSYSTMSTTPEPSYDYLVVIRSSNVPSIDYQYDAVGILQVLLQVTRNMTSALPDFLNEYQLRHDTHQWKLSHACGTLILPAGLTYLELYEHHTSTTIYLFV